MISVKVLQAIKPISNVKSILTPSSLLVRATNDTTIDQKRTVIYYDRNTARRHSDQEAVKRYFRLNWGGWIRTRAGRKNHLWQKPWFIKWYIKQHVFCTEKECEDLEKMIAPDIKKPRHFIDDIYAPYHKRHGINICPHGKYNVGKSYVKKMAEEL